MIIHIEQFLRHIRRTKMIAHLVSFENLSKGTTGMMKVYKEIRKELEKYDKNLKLGDDGLSKKDEIIILTKSDTTEDIKIIKKEVEKFKKINKNIRQIPMPKKLKNNHRQVLIILK